MSVSGPDSDYLPEILEGLSDRELLDRLERALEAVVYVDDHRLIAFVDPSQNLRLWRNFTAAQNEAYRRGYSEDDVKQGVAALAKQRGLVQRLEKETGTRSSPDAGWRRLEQIVAEIHRLDGPDWSVVHNDKVIDRTTNSRRQLDVTVRFKKGMYEFLVVIECRDQQANISIDDIDGFAQKLEDVRASKGVLVTTSDFAPNARDKAVFCGIETYTAAEAVEIDWQPHIRQIVSTFPLPQKVSFVPPIEGSVIGAPSGYYGDLSFSAFILEDLEGRQVDDLAHILWRLGLQLMKDQTPLPARVRVELDPAMVLRIDRFGIRMPIRAIQTTVVWATRTRQVQIERPTLERRVRYRNVRTGDERIFVLAPEAGLAETQSGGGEALTFEEKLRKLQSLIRMPLQVKAVDPLVLTTGDTDFQFEGTWPPNRPCADERPLAPGDTVFLTGLVVPVGQISYTAPCGCMYSTHRMMR